MRTLFELCGSYLGVIRSARSEEGLERVVAGKEETSEVDKELASDVEENKEEVNTDKTQDNVDLRDIGLTLQVVQNGVLGKLLFRKKTIVSTKPSISQIYPSWRAIGAVAHGAQAVDIFIADRRSSWRAANGVVREGCSWRFASERTQAGNGNGNEPPCRAGQRRAGHDPGKRPL